MSKKAPPKKAVVSDSDSEDDSKTMKKAPPKKAPASPGASGKKAPPAKKADSSDDEDAAKKAPPAKKAPASPGASAKKAPASPSASGKKAPPAKKADSSDDEDTAKKAPPAKKAPASPGASGKKAPPAKKADSSDDEDAPKKAPPVKKAPVKKADSSDDEDAPKKAPPVKKAPVKKADSSDDEDGKKKAPPKKAGESKEEDNDNETDTSKMTKAQLKRYRKKMADAEAAAGGAKPAASAPAASEAKDEEGGEKVLSEAQKKRLRQKKKQEEEEAKKAAEGDKAKKAGVALLKQRLEAQKAAAEAAEKERLAEIARIEEEERKEREAEQKREEDRLKRLKAKAEKKEADKAAGKAVTKAEKAKERALRERRAQMEAAGLVPAVRPKTAAEGKDDGDEDGEDHQSQASGKSSKTSKGNKGKKGKGKGKLDRTAQAKLEAERIRAMAAAAPAAVKEEKKEDKDEVGYKAAEKLHKEAVQAAEEAEEQLEQAKETLRELKEKPVEESEGEPESEEDQAEEEEEVPDSWDAIADKEEEDVPDAWDASDDDMDKPVKKGGKSPAKKGGKAAPKASDKRTPKQIARDERSAARKQERAAKRAAEVAKMEATIVKLGKKAAQLREAAEEAREDFEAKAEELRELREENKPKNNVKVARGIVQSGAVAEAKKESESDSEDGEDEEASGGKKVPKPRKDAEMRSPILCILGHVDTGKTKLLDKIRSTNVQEGEAGGITQQIGATYFPQSTMIEKTECLKAEFGTEFSLPGLLIIDTPGHESFTNLRSRGSNLCDIAILVVDIMHGLEPQTIESINLLRMRKTPFVVALNKIDRCYGWKPIPNGPFRASLAVQNRDTQQEFETRVASTITLFAEQGLNCCLYYKNTDFRKYVSLIPTSAITGEGIPDMLMLIAQLTQKMMGPRLQYITSLQCTVLEVKVVEGLGTTLDVVLVNGYLNEGDTIVVCGLNGPIVTTIRALLTPAPLRELRVKGEYQHLKRIKAAMGVKISAHGLEHAVAGSQLLVCGPRDDLEELKDEVMGDLATILSRVDKSGQGVCVQASTLGSLEALLSFLEESKIPVSGIAIGPVHKKDVMRASVMLQHKPEYGVLLAFDVKVDENAQKWADDLGVKIFTADIIYHLFDQCTAYMEKIRQEKRDAASGTAIFPMMADIMPQHVYRVRDPIIMGCKITGGIAKVGTPLCVFKENNPEGQKVVPIGIISSIEHNHVAVHEAKELDEVALKIEPIPGDQKCTFGRQFDGNDKLYSMLTRRSIDLLKENFKDDLKEADWRLVIKLKKMFNII